jgi:hypothetical protein
LLQLQVLLSQFARKWRPRVVVKTAAAALVQSSQSLKIKKNKLMAFDFPETRHGVLKYY